jgi:hypothetical protein
MFLFAALTIVVCIGFVVGWNRMLDVAIDGEYGGKLRLLCQGWYVDSSRTMQNIPFDSE